MANRPGNPPIGHGNTSGRRPQFGGGSGARGPDPSGGRGANRVHEIEEALRPPAQPASYLTADRRTVRPELVGEEAKDTAKKLASIPASQLRRFYAEVMALKRRIELTTAVTDDEVQAQMALLKAKAAYTCRRREEYPLELVRFFTRHAAAVRGSDDFKRGFQPHFEAVMAYHRVFEVKKGEGEA